MTIMHTKTQRIKLVINSTLLQTSMKLADWRSVILCLLGLRSSVAELPLCFFGDTSGIPEFGKKLYRVVQKTAQS